jgi:hypothetical protein
MLRAGLSLDELTDLYFSLEEPAERDAFMDLLQPLQGPEVDAFLRAMMAHDEDLCMRAAAAEMLMGRGDAAGLAYFMAQLAQPDDEAAFVQAVGLLVQQRGAAIYPDLAAIWRDPERSTELRREALWGMERAHRDRTLAQLLDWCAPFARGSASLAELPEDLLESAILCFARARLPAAKPLLGGLQQLVDNSRLSAEQRAVWGALLAQGLALLGH